MANALYDPGREGCLDGSIVYSSDTIKVRMLAAGYVFSAAHKFLSDITGSAAVGTDQTLGTKTVTGGVADAADAVFTAVASGSTVTMLIIYKDTGVAGTSRLIAFIDTGSGGAISVATNGGNITIQWDNGANKIFKL